MKHTGPGLARAMRRAWEQTPPLMRAAVRWKCPDVRVVGKATEPGLMGRMR